MKKIISVAIAYNKTRADGSLPNDTTPSAPKNV